MPTNADQVAFLPKEALADLVRALCDDGYQVIAPILRQGVVSMQPITDAAQIASGVRDDQDGGRYRLEEGDEDLTFEYVVGPDGPKRYFFPPQQKLFALHVEGERFTVDQAAPMPPKMAFIGVRPCELAAITVQDKVFGYEDEPTTFRCESETYYCEARKQSLLIAVNCTRPGGTCFCTSWDTGPAAKEDFDLALTELRNGFVVRVGSKDGQALAKKLPTREATLAELELEEMKLERAAERMGREMDTDGLVKLLHDNIDHHRWKEVARRCFACGNCTMVCPTCFCSTVTDGTDLSTGQSTRTRQWESCYTHQFSYTTSGPGRNTIEARYRHWIRHKLATWWDQFETSGCVGCGRCITWCPVGIDLTEEVEAIRESTGTGHHAHAGSHHTREVAS